MDLLQVPTSKNRRISTFSNSDCSSLGSSNKENKYSDENKISCDGNDVNDFSLNSPGLHDVSLSSPGLPESPRI